MESDGTPTGVFYSGEFQQPQGGFSVDGSELLDPDWIEIL